MNFRFDGFPAQRKTPLNRYRRFSESQIIRVYRLQVYLRENLIFKCCLVPKLPLLGGNLINSQKEPQIRFFSNALVTNTGLTTIDCGTIILVQGDSPLPISKLENN